MKRILIPTVALLLTIVLGACAPPTTAVRDETGRQEITSLRHQQQETARSVERLQDDVSLIEARQRAQQQSIDELRSSVSAQKVTPPGEKAGPPAASPPPAKVETTPASADLFRQAFGDYASGRYPQAIVGFENFLRLHPGHPQAGSALYWLGECYYAAHHYAKAAEAFGKVAEMHPSGGRAPDALLRLAATLKQMRDDRRAGEILKLLREKYPQSAAARKSLDNE